MIAAIFTIILGVAAFVMFGQPVFWAYSGVDKASQNAIYKQQSCYDLLNFESIDNIYLFIGKICLLIAMVFAAMMIILALAHLFGRAAGNPRPRVEVRLIACCFFLFMLAAAILLMVYMQQKTGQTAINSTITESIGYGFISAFGAALLSIFFAPSRRGRKERIKAKKLKKEEKQAKESQRQMAASQKVTKVQTKQAVSDLKDEKGVFRPANLTKK